MTPELGTFRAEYREAFLAHLHGGGEAGLRAAYELGRAAMRHNLSVLDLAGIHHDVLFGALAEAPGTQLLAERATATSTFFLEVLSTYEMVQRGVVEAHETARLEQRHADRLRRLAEASLAISAAGTLQEVVRRIPEQAVRVLTAVSATVVVQPAGRAKAVHSYPAALEHGAGPGHIGAPLLRRNGSRLGQVMVFGEESWTPADTDGAILAQLARVAGIALENAELYEQQRLVAETLQHRLLPAELPRFTGAAMAWRYLPGWVGSDIGGDWYDAMVLPDGRLALAVGDVMGKGIRAAAGMGQLRIALRAYAVEGHPPAVVVQRLDRVVEGLEEDFATAVYLVYDPETATLRYANAGHPPPLLVAPDGSVRLLGDGLSPPLGILGDATAEGVVEVPAGSVLVVYTDGLVERRETDVERGIDRLREVAVSGDSSDLDRFCDLVLEGMDADGRSDDIALLAARFG